MFDNLVVEYQDILRRFREETQQTNAVLAGGCLRDTFYGVEVKDLDFVVECSRAHGGYRYPFSPHSPVLTRVWPDKRFHYCQGDDDGRVQEGEMAIGLGGNNSAGLLEVIESTDKKINIILVKSILQYTQQFPDSISQMVFNGNEIIVSTKWHQGAENGKVYYRWDIKTPRLMKLKAKYPTWEFIPEVW